MSELTGQVVERRHDRALRNYTGIPVHLLIDREEAEVTVFAEPSGDAYVQAHRHKLGLVVPLPAPLGFELDTAEF